MRTPEYCALATKSMILCARAVQLWGEPFYFQYNPTGTLEITVTDRQFMHSEEMGRVRVSTEYVTNGLRGAWMNGEKT
jgi:hypothetical protein